MGFYIEDYGSTNGTWLRISPELTPSAEYQLEHESYVKLGTAITYICRINNGSSLVALNNNDNSKLEGETMLDENTCRICHKNENNCLFLPCSHNLCCIECSSVLDKCIDCDHSIDEKIKIHK